MGRNINRKGGASGTEPVPLTDNTFSLLQAENDGCLLEFRREEMTEKAVVAQFWNWFANHERELFNFDPEREAERERIFDQIAHELQKIDPDLCFEFGPNNTRREFVVSAGGIKRAFPAVVSLVAAAPTFDRWHVIAFRPRRTPPNSVKVGGRLVHPKDVQFSLLDNGKKAGLYLFIPAYQEGDTDLAQIGYLLLDEALGEYDVETRLGLIKMLSPQTPTQGERFPLADLPTLFDKLVSRLEGRSGRHS
jgi:hypothetical protein